MTRRKSVQDLVKPLRKLNLLAGSHATKSVSPAPVCNERKDHEQHDIISWLPREIALEIFALLSFDSLVQVQLTCQLWRRIAQDPSIWQTRYHDLCKIYPDLYRHKSRRAPPVSLPWQTRYCQAVAAVNWRTGNVQRLHMIANEGGRILSVKLRGYWLVTLAEDNVVRLYQYETAKGFQPKSKWAFGDPSQPTNIVECVDLLPEINILVVAFRGSKCIFYDYSKHPTEPIQILKGGSHPWFVPDSICLSRDYFAVCGRKPSAVFVWNWRKGVRLSNRAFDNQPYSVYLSGDNLIAMSVDGLVYIFDLFDHTKDATLSTTLPPCSMPCLQYDGTLSVVLAPFASRRVHHFQWNSAATEAPTTPSDQNPPPVVLTSSTSTPHPTLSTRRRLSATLSSSVSSLLGRSQKKPKKRASVGSCTKSLRLRRHSSYNDYGYACQMRTAQYIKKAGELKPEAEETPDLTSRLKLIHSVRTTPLGRTAQEVVNVASRNGRVVTVNRHGDMAMYALNGATAARVTFKSCEWMESWDETAREDDDLSDGYDFVRTRLAIGDMGIVYGCRGGALWWLDFGCRPNA